MDSALIARSALPRGAAVLPLLLPRRAGCARLVSVDPIVADAPSLTAATRAYKPLLRRRRGHDRRLHPRPAPDRAIAAWKWQPAEDASSFRGPRTASGSGRDGSFHVRRVGGSRGRSR